MFTGIIKNTAPIVSVKKRGGNLAIAVQRPALWEVGNGESISVNGICSTVTKAARGVIHFEYMPESLRLTTVDEWRVGKKVNLERSLRVGDALDGHLVTGHIDGVGRIAVSVRDGRAQLLKVEAQPALLALIAKKGSVAIDGVSLTVADACPLIGRRVGDCWFSVALIPYTLAHTNLQFREVGDRVNIEVDILAKYAARFQGER